MAKTKADEPQGEPAVDDVAALTRIVEQRRAALEEAKIRYELARGQLDALIAQRRGPALSLAEQVKRMQRAEHEKRLRAVEEQNSAPKAPDHRSPLDRAMAARR